MKQDHLIAAEAQRLNRFDDDGRIFVKVRDHHHHAAAVQEILEVHKWLSEIGARAGVRLFDGVQQAEQLTLPRGGRHVVGDVFVEDDQAGRVALHIGQVTERGGQKARVVELVDGVGSIAHGSRRIEQHQQSRVGLAAVALEIAAAGARENVPVHVAQVIALRVGAVFGELLREAEIR